MEYLIYYGIIAVVFFFIYCFILAKYGKIKGNEVKYTTIAFLLTFIWPFVTIYLIGFGIVVGFTKKEMPKEV